MLKRPPSSSAAGFALIEAMITVLILVVGLLGLVGLQNRMLIAEMESYQRSQAIILANDMAQRIMANPKGMAGCYAGAAVGTGVSSAPTCSGSAAATQASADIAAWHNALLGNAEKTSGAAAVGAMIGARGCITDIDAVGTAEVLVTVAWQGLTETVATPVACGTGQYTLPGAGTASDAARRTLSIAVRAAKLD